MLLYTEVLNSPDLRSFTEQTTKGRACFIEGPMIQCNAKNRNGRIYPREMMEAVVERYVQEYVNQRRALGELNHPDRPFADPANAAIKIESLEWRGDLVVGKARVLNTTQGMQIQALLEADFNLGVSTRGLGQSHRSGSDEIMDKYILTAIDAVDLPSGQTCYVNQVNESVEWVEIDGVWQPKKREIVEPFNESVFLNAMDQMVETFKANRRAGR